MAESRGRSMRECRVSICRLFAYSQTPPIEISLNHDDHQYLRSIIVNTSSIFVAEAQ
jgi:hypothetical protein